MRFTAWAPNWDEMGADHITLSTASHAIQLAQEALAVAAEPFVAPAADGSLMLQWRFPNGAEVEFYVEPDETVGTAVVDVSGQIHEISVSSVESLLRVLEDASA